MVEASKRVADDCERLPGARGNPLVQAQRFAHFSDQTATVFDPTILDDRLDQFASLLAGY